MSLPDSEKPAQPNGSDAMAHFDIAIIGAGIAGTSAASALSQAGFKIALIDFRDRHPPDFRAEKIGERQMVFFDSFGLGPAARRQMTAFDGVWVHRFGRIVEKRQTREYSSPYGDLVNATRAALPDGIHKLVGRVTAVRTSPGRQEVELSGGQTLSARLVVVATGLGDTVRNTLGIERVVSSPNHSIGSGFDIANPSSDFPFTSLVWITERPADKTAYLTLFPMGDRVRANLFVYRTPDDPWCVQFRKHPTASLRALLPDFARAFRPIEVEGPVQFRPIDIAKVSNHKQAGVVLIGDAFFTTCPVSGTGMDKALNDVDRLRSVVPQWFATPGMGTEKIEQFYADPVKLDVDAGSLDLSLRERAIRMDASVSGKVLRLRRNVLRRGAYRVQTALTWLRPLQQASNG